MPAETHSQEAVEATLVFAQNVREHMDAQGLSIAELARKANVDRGGLTNLLNGKGGNCTIATGQKLAEALKVQLWQLIKPAKKQKATCRN